MKKRRKARGRAMAFTPEMQDAILKMQTDKQRGELGFAIMDYAFYGKECESEDETVRSAFEGLRSDIDKSITEEAIREEGYTEWWHFKSAVRSWWFVIRIRLWRAFHKTEG